MVLPRFVDQALRGKPITVFGTGQQTRCFADVSDVVRAILMLMAHPKAVGQVFNVGNPEEISILDLARLVKKSAASRSEIQVIPYDEAYQPGFEDMERRVPSIDKISRLVGYKPKLKLQEIVSRMIAYRREELAAETLTLTPALRSEPLRAGVGE
jgi:UDP-glucose 4-epimerase